MNAAVALVAKACNLGEQDAEFAAAAVHAIVCTDPLCAKFESPRYIAFERELLESACAVLGREHKRDQATDLLMAVHKNTCLCYEQEPVLGQVLPRLITKDVMARWVLKLGLRALFLYTEGHFADKASIN